VQALTSWDRDGVYLVTTSMHVYMYVHTYSHIHSAMLCPTCRQLCFQDPPTSVLRLDEYFPGRFDSVNGIPRTASRKGGPSSELRALPTDVCGSASKMTASLYVCMYLFMNGQIETVSKVVQLRCIHAKEDLEYDRFSTGSSHHRR
jgi:hypothetical protein